MELTQIESYIFVGEIHELCWKLLDLQKQGKHIISIKAELGKCEIKTFEGTIN